jgi:NADP-dependent 3-hydroxy acid dehydrogenase YdfG
LLLKWLCQHLPQAAAKPQREPNGVSEPEIAEAVRAFYEIALPAESFAQAVAFAISQPDEVDVNEILFRPTRQVH